MKALDGIIVGRGGNEFRELRRERIRRLGAVVLPAAFQIASLPFRLVLAVAGRLGRLTGYRPRFPVDVSEQG